MIAASTCPFGTLLTFPSTGGYGFNGITIRNAPVYLFCKRHIYLPLLDKGFPQSAALLIVFTVSAILHELVIGVPTHNISGIAFWGMLGQIPLIWVTAALESFLGGDRQGQVFTMGNLIFCLVLVNVGTSFCILGQPAAVLLYYVEYVDKHGM